MTFSLEFSQAYDVSIDIRFSKQFSKWKFNMNEWQLGCFTLNNTCFYVYGIDHQVITRTMLGILHCVSPLIEVESTNTIGFTSIREVIHNVVYECNMTSIFVSKIWKIHLSGTIIFYNKLIKFVSVIRRICFYKCDIQTILIIWREFELKYKGTGTLSTGLTHICIITRILFWVFLVQ